MAVTVCSVLEVCVDWNAHARVPVPEAVLCGGGKGARSRNESASLGAWVRVCGYVHSVAQG